MRESILIELFVKEEKGKAPQHAHFFAVGKGQRQVHGAQAVLELDGAGRLEHLVRFDIIVKILLQLLPLDG